jgi:lipoprotein-anchoring transpeptidase ErfK/SrfK
MDPFTLATPTTAATQRFQVAYHGGFYTIYDLYSQDYLSVDAETGRVGRVYVARDTPDAQLPVSVRFEVMEVASGGEVVVPVALPSEGLAESAGEVVVAPVSAGGLLGFSFEATSYRPKGDFIVVDKAAQEMACFKGGYKQLESDCATAMPKLHATTPKGTFRILHKQCDRWLSGPSWSVPVKFWVPFTTNGVGFHDASWEKTFGGSSYLTEGSHGCVHMPTKAMAALYKLCFVGERVVVM